MTIPNSLSEKTAVEIEALARKISVAEGLDGDIQAELRGHIEDKVRGYVLGEVKVSETDAILLAKAHFGEAGVIKELFRHVHAPAYAGSLMRRASIAALMFLLIPNISKVVVRTVWYRLYFRGALVEAFRSQHVPPSVQPPLMPQLIYGLVASALSLLAMWFILRPQRNHRYGLLLALNNVRVRTLAMLFGGCCLLWILADLPAVSEFLWPVVYIGSGGLITDRYDFNPPMWYFVATTVISLIATGIAALIWIRWCAPAARTARSVLFAALSWLVFGLVVDPAFNIVYVAGFNLATHQPRLLWFYLSESGVFHISSYSVCIHVVMGFVIGAAYMAIKRSRHSLIAD